MAAGIIEPDGHQAGRVTIVTTLTSLVPPVVTSLIVILCFVLEVVSADVAAVAVLTALGLGGVTSGVVFGAAKRTPTDQARTVWGSPPVAGDIVTPPPGTPVVTPEVSSDVTAEGDAAARLREELSQIRPAHRAGGV